MQDETKQEKPLSLPSMILSPEGVKLLAKEIEDERKRQLDEAIKRDQAEWDKKAAAVREADYQKKFKIPPSPYETVFMIVLGTMFILMLYLPKIFRKAVERAWKRQDEIPEEE